MYMETFVWLYSHGLEHGWPENGVGLEDVLGYDMFGHVPVLVKIRTVRKTDASEVINKGVKPHIGDEVFVKGQGYPPCQP